MNPSVAVVRPRPGVPLLAPEERERSVRRRVGIAWGLLVLDTLTFYPGVAVVPIPSVVGKLITQGALPVALLLAMSVNRRVIRPNVFLCLASLLVIEALITTLQPQHVGTIYRTFRLAEFVVVLWLLSPWWGRRDLLLVRAYLTSLSVVLGLVLLGLVVAPGHAIPGGRLSGAIWPVPSPQVAHYAAVTTGLVVVLWFGGLLRGRVTLIVTGVTVSMLLLTHTRTALIGVLAGILVAALSLFTTKARVRKFLVAAGLVATVGVLTLAGVVTAWLARGESTQQLSNLTGRTKVWTALVSFPRTHFQEVFGFGLSNSSFNGLPIDSNWLSSYQEQGLLGVTVCAAMLLFLLVSAYFQPRGVQRALALFLVTYCLIASYTEDGFTDATTYLLELTLAASLLVPSRASRAAPVPPMPPGSPPANTTGQPPDQRHPPGRECTSRQPWDRDPRPGLGPPTSWMQPGGPAASRASSSPPAPPHATAYSTDTAPDGHPSTAAPRNSSCSATPAGPVSSCSRSSATNADGRSPAAHRSPATIIPKAPTGTPSTPHPRPERNRG